MIEIFKTNVNTDCEAAIILKLLDDRYLNIKVNFDLDDCDKILRIRGNEFCALNVIELLKKHGFECELIE